MKANEGFAVIAEYLRERSTTGLSFSNIRAQLSTAVQSAHSNAYCYVAEIHGSDEAGDVIYEMGGKMMRRKYKISTERGVRKTTLGDPAAVLPRIAWDEVEATEETRAMESGAKTFSESAGVVYPLGEASAPRQIKLIAPGWGSSGYYPAEVLKRDGPKIFKAGTHMYMNHQTRAEESERPEGDMNHLAGVLMGNAHWDGSHKEGPGLYAPIDVFSRYSQHIAETAPFTGVSIRARGTGKDGKAEGKTGFIVDELTYGESVDFVTRAGAGGKVLTESERTGDGKEVKESTMDKAEVQALIEAGTKDVREANASLLTENGALKAQILKLNQRSLSEDAHKAARAICANPEFRLTEAVQNRIVSRAMVLTIPTVKETGELDQAAWKTVVEAQVKDEAAYLASLGTGNVRLGESAPTTPAEIKTEEANSRLKEAYIAQGYTDKQAEYMLKGRVN